MFQIGRIDFAEMIDRMYKSIEQYRLAALYDAFVGMDTNLPTDMKLQVAFSATTKPQIVEHIEGVAAATGKNVMLVGTRVALQRLQDLVNYAMFSEEMKNEYHETGMLGKWEGYDCLALQRVNKAGTRTSVFTSADNHKIYILPIDPDFKPIKRVNEGDVMYFESGMDGMKKDMTADAEIAYQEGIGVVINELFGTLVDNNT